MASYKKKPILWCNEKLKRATRHAEVLKARESSRFERFSMIRDMDSDIEEKSESNTQSKIETNMQSTKPSRTEMLRKWKEEKQLKQELELKAKKKPFYVGLNQPPSKVLQNVKSLFNRTNCSVNVSKIQNSKIQTLKTSLKPNFPKQIAPPKISVKTIKPPTVPKQLNSLPKSTPLGANTSNMPKFGTSSSKLPKSTPFVASTSNKLLPKATSIQSLNQINSLPKPTNFTSKARNTSGMPTALTKAKSTSVVNKVGLIPTIKKNEKGIVNKPGTSKSNISHPKPANKVIPSASNTNKAITGPKFQKAPIGSTNKAMVVPKFQKIPPPPLNKNQKNCIPSNPKQEIHPPSRKGYNFRAAFTNAFKQKAECKGSSTKDTKKLNVDAANNCSQGRQEPQPLEIQDITLNCDLSMIQPNSSFAPSDFKFSFQSSKFVIDEEDIEELQMKFMSRTSTPSKIAENGSTENSVASMQDVINENINEAFSIDDKKISENCLQVPSFSVDKKDCFKEIVSEDASKELLNDKNILKNNEECLFSSEEKKSENCPSMQTVLHCPSTVDKKEFPEKTFSKEPLDDKNNEENLFSIEKRKSESCSSNFTIDKKDTPEKTFSKANSKELSDDVLIQIPASISDLLEENTASENALANQKHIPNMSQFSSNFTNLLSNMIDSIDKKDPSDNSIFEKENKAIKVDTCKTPDADVSTENTKSEDSPFDIIDLSKMIEFEEQLQMMTLEEEKTHRGLINASEESEYSKLERKSTGAIHKRASMLKNPTLNVIVEDEDDCTSQTPKIAGKSLDLLKSQNFKKLSTLFSQNLNSVMEPTKEDILPESPSITPRRSKRLSAVLQQKLDALQEPARFDNNPVESSSCSSATPQDSKQFALLNQNVCLSKESINEENPYKPSATAKCSEQLSNLLRPNVGSSKASTNVENLPESSNSTRRCKKSLPVAYRQNLEIFEESIQDENSSQCFITPRRSLRLLQKKIESSEVNDSPMPFEQRPKVGQRQSMRLIDLNTPEIDSSQNQFKTGISADFARLKLDSENSENMDPSLKDIEDSSGITGNFKSRKVSLLFTPEKSKGPRKSIRGDLMSFSPSF